jgi:hypothetical protein
MELNVTFEETNNEMDAYFGQVLPVHAYLNINDDSISNKEAWSSKNTVDKLCPSFSYSGSVVTCEPVEGYPLTVTSEEGATTINRCGKNLLNEDWKTFKNYTNNKLVLSLPKGKYVLSAEKNDGATTYLYLQKSIDGGTTWEIFYHLHTNNSVAFRTVSFEVTGAEGEVWSLWTSTQKYLDAIKCVQIECGEVATSYEPYNGGTFTAIDTITAMHGVNNIFANTGEITVTGKADPNVVIKKLTNAIIALGGNV